MYYIDDFRDDDLENYDYTETDVPTWCPFCQEFDEEDWSGFERQPNPGPDENQPFGGPFGMPQGPQGKPFGPQGGQFGPQGKPFGPQGGQFEPQGKPFGQQGKPSGPPPYATPSKQQAMAKHGAAPMAVEPGTLYHCLYRYVYIWPRRGRGFWAWLTYVGRRSVAGYRWDGRRWVYFGMDLRQIDSFICY